MTRTITVDLSQDGDAVLAEFRRRTFGPYEMQHGIRTATATMIEFGDTFKSGREIIMRYDCKARARLEQSCREYRLGRLRIQMGIDLYEDHGPCWRLIIGEFEFRRWLGSWGTR